MKVTILGPNLRDQSKGTFHIHKTGCADIERSYRGEEYWTPVEVSNRLEVVIEVYGDHLTDYGETPETPGGQKMLREEYLPDLWFAPCLKQLK